MDVQQFQASERWVEELLRKIVPTIEPWGRQADRWIEMLDADRAKEKK